MARILCWGTSRARWVAAPSAPRSTSGSPKKASSLAITMSALPARPMPPPTQKPLTAAISGTGQSYTAANAAKQPLLAPIRAAKPSVFCISLMSTPALKPLPSLRNTTTRVSGSLPAAVMVSASSNHPATVNALTGGTSTTTSAIPRSSRSHVIPTAREPTGDLTKRQIPSCVKIPGSDGVTRTWCFSKGSRRMIDEFAKEYLLDDLRISRATMLWKLDGLGEYDIRRPLTPTGTNLLGLIKHLTITEAWYFGEVFARPFPERLPWRDGAADERDDDAKLAAYFDHKLLLADMWPTNDESRVEIVDRYRRMWGHSDATIAALDIDAPGRVAWWPRPDGKLFNVMVHVLNETNRHAGHADILREQLDGAVGTVAGGMDLSGRDTTFWENHRAEIERAAQAADRA